MNDANALPMIEKTTSRPFDTWAVHKALMAVISEAEAKGVDEETLDRMRAACEAFTVQVFFRDENRVEGSGL